jgi:hypothetical protein
MDRITELLQAMFEDNYLAGGFSEGEEYNRVCHLCNKGLSEQEYEEFDGLCQLCREETNKVTFPVPLPFCFDKF